MRKELGEMDGRLFKYKFENSATRLFGVELWQVRALLSVV
jgi:hypothetical protein